MVKSKREEIAEDLLEITHSLKSYLGMEKETGRRCFQARGTASNVKAPVQRPNSLEAIQAELSECGLCSLSSGRRSIVFGEGNPNASLIFVGEGPGEDEDIQGRPFVGRAGQLLNKIITAMGLRREDVYIANVVKCRPPRNRAPLPNEVQACTPFLQRQIKVIGPKVICALGTSAAHHLLHTDVPVSVLRGRFHPLGGLQVMVTYHPAYLLRNPSAKKQVWEDMQKIMAVI